MKCEKCNENILKTDKFCPNCGTKIEIRENLDEELLKSFIGPKKEKFEKSKFSFPTLFLSTMYFMYRKMYILAAGWFLIALALNVLLPNIASYIIIIANFVMAFFFNELYVKNAKEKVNDIKKENKNKSEDELKKICSKKGRTTLAPLYFILGYIVLTIIYMVPTVINEIKDIFKTKNETSTSLLLYNVPDYFKRVETKEDTYTFENQLNSCNFTIEDVDIKYISIQDYLKQKYNENYSLLKLEVIDINGTYWTHLTLEPENQKDIYVTIKNNKIYELTFETLKDEDGKCSKAHEEVKNSLDFSKIEEL